MTADHDRLALAEVECWLAYADQTLADYTSMKTAPAMPADERSAEVARVEERREGARSRQASLAAAVPDPDSVVGPDGSTPPERRAQHLILYVERRRERRAEEVRKLETATRAAADKTLDRDVRSRARFEKQSATTHIEAIDEEPSDAELTPDDMCPDALHLATSHAYSCNLARPKWPCSAWPGEREKMRQVWGILNASASRPRTDLNTWELTLYCSHTAQRQANRCYETYARASGGNRACEVCGEDPGFVISERLVADPEARAVTAEPAAPPSLTPAARKRAERRVAKLEAELSELRSSLARTDTPPP